MTKKYYRYRIFALVFVLILINYIDRGALSFAVNDISKEYNLSKFEIGQILGFFGFGYLYNPSTKHTMGWLLTAKGSLVASKKAQIDTGEKVAFEENESTITLTNIAQENAIFVLGSSIPHPYQLHLGMYSVHISVKALKLGKQHIADLGEN